MRHTVVCGSFQHETNTFVEEPTDRNDFRERRELFGDEVEPNLRGTETQVGGVIDGAAGTDVDVSHVVAATATPGGIVEEATYEFYAETIVDGIRSMGADVGGVILPPRVDRLGGLCDSDSRSRGSAR